MNICNTCKHKIIWPPHPRSRRPDALETYHYRCELKDIELPEKMINCSDYEKKERTK